MFFSLIIGRSDISLQVANQITPSTIETEGMLTRALQGHKHIRIQ